MKNIIFRITAFVIAFTVGFVGFWTVMLALTILTGHDVIDANRLPYETQQIILDIRCDEDDAFCRGEKCRS